MALQPYNQRRAVRNAVIAAGASAAGYAARGALDEVKEAAYSAGRQLASTARSVPRRVTDYYQKRSRRYTGKRSTSQRPSTPMNRPYRLSFRKHPGLRKTRKRKRVTKKTLAREIKKVKRAAETDIGLLTYKFMADHQIAVNKGEVAYGEYVINATSSLGTFLSRARIYDPSSNSLQTIDLTSGTYNRDVLVQSIFSKLHLRNNTSAPAVVRVYCLSVKADHSIEPIQAIQQGLVDQDNSAVTATTANLQLYPTDIEQFNSLWSVRKSYKFTLEAGRHRVCRCQIPSFSYNPALEDSHSDAYQKKWKAHIWLVRVQGPIAHDDSTFTTVNFGDSRIDIIQERVVKVKYAAGKDLKDYIFDQSNLPDWSVLNARISNKPNAVVSQIDTT